MFAAALEVRSIDGAVKVSTPLTFNPDDDDEVAIRANLEFVSASQIVPGSVIVVPNWTDVVTLPLNTSVGNLQPTQIYLLVVSTSTSTIIVEVIL